MTAKPPPLGRTMKKTLLSLLALSSLLTFNAQAQDVTLGNPILGGPGCPQGSVSVSLTEDKKTISVLFSAFSTSYVAGGAPTKVIATNCRIQLPVTLPPGYIMDVMKLEYNGFHSVPDGSLFMISTNGLRVGKFSTTQPQQSQVKGPITDNYRIEHKLIRIATSECKSPSFMLDFTINMWIQSIGTRFGQAPIKGDAMATLDSLDSLGAGAQLGVALKRCK